MSSFLEKESTDQNWFVDPWFGESNKTEQDRWLLDFKIIVRGSPEIGEQIYERTIGKCS